MEELRTERGYREPTMTQFSVFLENRVGRLKSFLQLFDKSDIHVAAFSIVDSVDCAIVRCILVPSDDARELLRSKGLALSEVDVVVAELPSADALSQLCECLVKAELNIHYAYSLLVCPTGRPTVALYVDEPELAASVLRKSRFNLLGEADLK
jgi:hypothetical protein